MKPTHLPAIHGPRGFTLVEMLVAVTLVLLIMSMFAQIFQLAGGTIVTQRGIAENDQRARTLQNLLKADLDKRTFRTLVPWARDEDGTLAEAEATKRQGYFYISENDPSTSTDDMIQFTINTLIQTKNKDISPLYGKTTVIPGATNLLAYANQPEADDGWPENNGSGESCAAEVSYFMRGDRLYRRVLLLRQPLPLDITNTQPGYLDTSGASPVYRDFFDPSDTLTYYDAGPFWNDFDYSAFPLTNSGHARFHGLEDLNNASTQTQFPLGKPRVRFGHRRDLFVSREYDSAGNYFGRFTHEETSHSAFHYPQDGTNFMNAPGNMNTTRFVFPTFEGGPRRGEDLVMTNVQEFDVKVWDPTANGNNGQFVDIGSSNADTFNTSRRLNDDYGPWATSEDASLNHFNNTFDTWFPFPFVDGSIVLTPEMDMDGDGQNDLAPYQLLRHTRTSGGPATWAADADGFATGEEVFPTVGNSRANGLRFFYRCVKGGGDQFSVEPTNSQWPARAGARFQASPSEPTWEAVDNWRPISAIQITIRFLDVTSDQIRQLTLVHSMID